MDNNIQMIKKFFLIIGIMFYSVISGQDLGTYKVKTMLNIKPASSTFGGGCRNDVRVTLVYNDGSIQAMNQDLNGISTSQYTYFETSIDVLVSRKPIKLLVTASRNWERFLGGCGGNGSFNDALREGSFNYCTNTYNDIVEWWEDVLTITNTPNLKIKDYSVDNVLPIYEKIVLESDKGFDSNEYKWQYSLDKNTWIDLPNYNGKADINIDAGDILGVGNVPNFLNQFIYFRQKSTCNTYSNEVQFVINKYTKATQLELDKMITDGSFKPEAGKYIVSGWVKEEVSTPIVTYTSGVNVSLLDANTTLSMKNIKPVGQIIDGWQRMVGIFEIQSLSSLSDPKLKIELVCNSTNGDCYFDDIRFYPYNGNMKSFVYDEDTQRLMAELDENNYATFYEYDLEGGLVRVKKETERGVFTIQETRSNNPKKDK